MIRLAVRVARAHAEEALRELLVLSPAGLEEVEIDADTLEYVLYGVAGDLPTLPALEASVGDGLVTVSTSEIADDWAQRWREFHRPLEVAGRLYVRPPWHAAQPPGRLIDIAIDPGQAFGTGAHASTRGCLELLVGLARDGVGGPLLDLGCGSGILAIAAAKLGFSPVLALDNDQACIEATRANAEVNGAQVGVRLADLRTDPLPPTTTIVANLLLGPLLVLSARLEHVPQHLIASGLLADQGDELAAALQRCHGMWETARLRDGDWLAMLFAAAAPGVSSVDDERDRHRQERLGDRDEGRREGARRDASDGAV